MLLQKYKKYNNLFDANIFILSFLIIFFKWFSSFLVFNDENLINKILFDISDIHYLPFIFNILDLNFSPDYLNNINSENLIPIPIYSTISHAILFKLLSFSSFLILELFFLYIFLIIILKILLNCNINYYLALFTSIFIFILPSITKDIQLFNINLNIINGLYNFRFPRPLVTSCYYFWCLYLALSYYKNEKFEFKNFLFIGISLSLIFVSYYYNFVNLVILFIFLLLSKIFTDKEYLRNNYRNILYSIFIFLVFIIPYIYLFLFSEKDFSAMVGMIDLNYEYKVLLLVHFLSKIFTFKFIFIFILITFLRFFLIKFTNQINFKEINFFYYLFIATILSPFFFIIISPSVSEIYHFLNWIIIISTLMLIVYFSLFLNFVSKTLLSKYLKTYNYIFIFLSIFFIFIFQFINYEKLLNNEDELLRKDYTKLQKLIDNNSNDLNNLLSFSIRPQVLWMFKGKKEFSSIESSISSLNFDQLENNFIQNLKFLNISPENFSKIISNKKSSWRYNNEYIKYISWYRYQANSLITFNNSNDFDEKELEFIKNSSPTKTQQIILPKSETNRLYNSYTNVDIDNFSNKPDIIILNSESLILEYSNINMKTYCEIKNFDKLKVFILNQSNSCSSNDG